MFQCYFLRINIANNKHRKKTCKIIWEQNWCNGKHIGWEEVWLTAKKYSLADKKELGELDKIVTPLLLCIPTPLFNSFCCISQPPFIKSPVYSGPKSSCFAKDQLYTRFFNYSSFVNPLLHLIYLVMVFIYVKLKKAWSLVMQLLISY